MPIDTSSIQEGLLLLTGEDSQLDSMNIGLHRRTAPKVGAPSIIWHRCFWKPNSEFTDSQWQEAVGDLLSKIYIGLHLKSRKKKAPGPISPNHTNNKIDIFNSIITVDLPAFDAEKNEAIETQPIPQRFYQKTPLEPESFQDVFSFFSVIYGLNIQLRAVFHTEYWTMTISCDFSKVEQAEDIRDDRLSQIYTILTNLHNGITERYNDESRWNNASSHMHTPEKSDSTVADGEIYESTINSFMNFCDEFIDSCLEEVGLREVKHLSNYFGSFVGIIFGLRPTGDPKQLMKGHEPRIPLESVKDWAKRQPIPKRISYASKMNQAESLQLIDAAWPAVKALQGWHESEASQGKTNPEVTVNLLQRGRVLYASSLGRDLLTRNSDKLGPVVYTVFCVHANRWQLGRIVDRLHDLAALRLAAIRDFSKVFDAGRNLAEIKATLSGNIQDVHEISHRIDNEVENTVPSGMRFRLERSLYYIGRFRFLVRRLGMERVEGYQTYDEFVERRLSDKFATIEYVSRMYDQTNNTYRSKLNVDIQEGINKQISSTNKLLDAADKLSFIPLTYYLGHIIETLYDWDGFSLFGDHYKWILSPGKMSYASSGIIVLISIITLKKLREK